MTDHISIFGNKIGPGRPVFIIAEIGVNHNGNIDLAKRMIRKAIQCGADCVKFQTFKADQVVTENAPKAYYQLQTTSPEESQLKMLKTLEMSFDDFAEIIDYCHKHKVLFMSTPYNQEDVDLLDRLGVEAFKLASIHAAEPSFAKYVAQKGKPLIMSTGMATLSEVDEAVWAMRETGNNDIALLQCTTNYPSLHEDANLLSMKTMGDAFDVIVGYSDHTVDDIACIASVALGASIIEKHFTLDKSLPGPDQSTSANPEEFSRMVRNVRKAELVLGSKIKGPCKIEKENALGMRRSIVAGVDIPRGKILESNMLAFKRPASGIPAKFIDTISGKKAQRDIEAGMILNWADIGD